MTLEDQKIVSIKLIKNRVALTYSCHMFVLFVLESCKETILLQTQMGGKGVCHDIKGTDGTLFAPGLDTDKSLWVFVPELCRSIWLDYDTDVTVMDIPAKRLRY